MIRAVIIVFAVMLLVPVFANGDESIEQWKQYVESYRQYMEKYREWAHNTINLYKSDLSESQKTIELLKNDNKLLIQENAKYKDKLDEMTDYAVSLRQELHNSGSDLEFLRDYTNDLHEKSRITIYDQNIHWRFQDSHGNLYGWQIPIEAFEYRVKYNTSYDTTELFNPNTNENYNVPKLAPFVQQRFVNVIDQVWQNSESNYDFVYNVWFIVNQLTVYSSDLGEYPRYASETLGRGGGDCEDLAILIADMILSSKHTKNWELEFLIMDSNNPEKPQTANHVILIIDDGTNRYSVEPTATDKYTLSSWNGYNLSGWNEKIN